MFEKNQSMQLDGKKLAFPSTSGIAQFQVYCATPFNQYGVTGLTVFASISQTDDTVNFSIKHDFALEDQNGFDVLVVTPDLSGGEITSKIVGFVVTTKEPKIVDLSATKSTPVENKTTEQNDRPPNLPPEGLYDGEERKILTSGFNEAVDMIERLEKKLKKQKQKNRRLKEELEMKSSVFANSEEGGFGGHPTFFSDARQLSMLDDLINKVVLMVYTPTEPSDGGSNRHMLSIQIGSEVGRFIDSGLNLTMTEGILINRIMDAVNQIRSSCAKLKPRPFQQELNAQYMFGAPGVNFTNNQHQLTGVRTLVATLRNGTGVDIGEIIANFRSNGLVLTDAEAELLGIAFSAGAQPSFGGGRVPNGFNRSGPTLR